MNDTAIKNYAVWARRVLMGEVEKRCAWWDVSEGARGDIDSVDGRVLSAQEREQRKELLEMVKADGYAQLVERAAYTWFNRLLAIRFMEVNDRLPGHVRMLSAADGSFEPQCLAEALDLRLDALDRDEALRLVQEGDDEALFRLLFLAQCDELARCMPDVFEPVGSAMELLLPTGLLRADGVVGRLVGDIDEADWREGVEIVGWMYQYYVSERKDEVFASFKKGKKAERDAIAPATQLFTPHWIVRYLTENSLGRLWMLNHPESKLTEQMPYYVKPDEEHETKFRDISSPEEITVVDPACGSGHILVYAFDLLLAMYRESGYRDRDAVRSIMERNLTGLEIDRRAAAMASFALTMKACEADGRFLRRKVTPRITVLERVEFTDEELEVLPSLAANTDLLDAVAHLDECGSLLQVSESDVEDVKGDLASLSKGATVFAGSAEAKLVRLMDELAPLVARYDVVVANPPYMGGSNMNKWVAGWVKKFYPLSKRDICTCFIERGGALVKERGYVSMITASSWMFISSFEQFRRELLASGSICSMIQQSTHGYAGVTVPTTMFVFADSQPDIVGSYIRLEDFDRPQWQEEKALEALADPGCGWFYRRNVEAFEAIPGSPIAYWLPKSIIASFDEGISIDDLSDFTGSQNITGDNNRYLRFWWEVDVSSVGKVGQWIPYAKGGDYRRWYGNIDHVLDCRDEAIRFYRGNPTSNLLNERYWYVEGITYNAITSGRPHFRYLPAGCSFDKGGPSIVRLGKHRLATLGFLNSTTCEIFLSAMNPTLNLQVKDIKTLPVLVRRIAITSIDELVNNCIILSSMDWQLRETASNRFVRNPLL